MTTRAMMIATAVLMFGTSATAEPVQPAKPDVAQAEKPMVTVQLASASLDKPLAPASASDSAPVKKPRAARVTTCRCGETPNP